jgi:hypothetical protein
VDIVTDAVIESWHQHHLVATSARSVSIGDHFVIETSWHGGVRSWAATVIGCAPIITESPLRHRLRLSLTPLTPCANGDSIIVM